MGSKQGQHFAAGAHPRADGAFVGRAGFHILSSEGDAANLLPSVKARRGHASHLATGADDGCGEGPAGFWIDHAVTPAIEVDGGDVAIEIEIATGEDTVQVRAEGVLVAGKGSGEQLDALVWLIVDGSGVTAIKGENGLTIRVGAIGANPIRDDKIGPVLAAPVVGVVAEVHDRSGAADGDVCGYNRTESHLVERVGLRGA